MGLETLQIIRSIGTVIVLFGLALLLWYADQDRFDRMLNGYDQPMSSLTIWLGVAIVVIAQMMIWAK